jgi:hypothetical protein
VLLLIQIVCYKPAMNREYTEAEVIAAIKALLASGTPLKPTRAHNFTQVVKHKVPLSPEVAKAAGFTLRHYYTKDRMRYSYPKAPAIKKGKHYTQDEFISILIDATEGISQRTVSRRLGYSDQWFNKLLRKDIPPTAQVAKTFGFTRLHTGRKTYTFVKD